MSTPTRTDAPDGRRYCNPELVDAWPADADMGLKAGEAFSVTTILRTIGGGKSDALCGWAEKLTRKEMVARAGEVLNRHNETNDTYDPVTANQLMSSINASLPTKSFWWAERDKAGDIGTAGHALVENNLRDQMGRLTKVTEVSTDNAGAFIMLDHFRQWRELVEFEPTHVEQRLYSVTDRVAGTTDAIGTWINPDAGANPDKNRRVCVVDWKSSKGIYDEARIQSVAYGEMAVEMDLIGPDHDALVVRLPKEEGLKTLTAVVGPDEQSQYLEAFHAARYLFAAMRLLPKQKRGKK